MLDQSKFFGGTTNPSLWAASLNFPSRQTNAFFSTGLQNQINAAVNCKKSVVRKGGVINK